MANEDLVERLQKAFKEPEKVKAEEYQKIVEANASKAAENAERLTITLLSMIMVFILVLQGKIKSVDLGIVEIEDPSIILIMLPALAAYVHYDLIMSLSKFDLLSVIHKTIIKQRHQPIHDQRLTKYFLFPPTLYEYKCFSSSGLMKQIQSYLWVILFFSITTFIPIGFQIASFLKLGDLPPALGNPVMLIASLVIASLFSLQSILTIIGLFRQAGNQ